MGARERQAFRTELAELGRITADDCAAGRDESPEFHTQNARVAAAEGQLSWAENLWVRSG
jgi:hypothetical protein